MGVKAETDCLITLKGINKSYQQPNSQQITIIENISMALCTLEKLSPYLVLWVLVNLL